MLKSLLLIGKTGKMNQAINEVAEGYDIKITRITIEELKLRQKLEGIDLICEFSHSSISQMVFNIAQKLSIPILIGTTGHQDTDIFKNTSVPTCYAPNTCLEWLILKRAIKRISNLNQRCQIVIDDIHSPTKVDKPSGTVLDILDELPNNNTIINSIRTTNIPSWHKVNFYLLNQVITVEHQVLNRQIYADGAITLARALLNKEPGFYDPEHLID